MQYRFPVFIWYNLGLMGIRTATALLFPQPAENQHETAESIADLPIILVSVEFYTHQKPRTRLEATFLVGRWGSTGSLNRRPFGNGATLTHSYGLAANYRVSPQRNLSGWIGVTNATAQSGAAKGAQADIWNWAIALALPDWGAKGNLGAVLLGMPPKSHEQHDRQSRRPRDCLAFRTPLSLSN